MTDIDLKIIFDNAFKSCQVADDDAFSAAVTTCARYARLLGTYENLILKLARTDSDKRMVSNLLKDFSYDALGKVE